MPERPQTAGVYHDIDWDLGEILEMEFDSFRSYEAFYEEALYDVYECIRAFNNNEISFHMAYDMLLDALTAVEEKYWVMWDDTGGPDTVREILNDGIVPCAHFEVEMNWCYYWGPGPGGSEALTYAMDDPTDLIYRPFRLGAALIEDPLVEFVAFADFDAMKLYVLKSPWTKRLELHEDDGRGDGLVFPECGNARIDGSNITYYTDEGPGGTECAVLPPTIVQEFLDVLKQTEADRADFEARREQTYTPPARKNVTRDQLLQKLSSRATTRRISRPSGQPTRSPRTSSSGSTTTPSSGRWRARPSTTGRR